MRSVVILGPTAVGKTDISLKIDGIDYEIISADSVQVYKYLNIGSGKPDLESQKRIKHHLIDVVDPDYSFSAGDFCRQAKLAADNIEKKNKIPLFVGGTGLYIDSFFQGLSNIPEIDDSIRVELIKILEKKDVKYLYNELISIDKEFAAKIHSNDKQRIIRGLEVYKGTGKTISSYYSSKIGYKSHETLLIGLNEDREILRERIDIRVDCMINSGLVDEVRSLRQMGYGPELKSMKTIGYLEINKYLNEEISLDEAIDEIKKMTKKYAKRQMTWFKRNTEIHWFKKNENKKINELIDNWYKNLNK